MLDTVPKAGAPEPLDTLPNQVMKATKHGGAATAAGAGAHLSSALVADAPSMLDGELLPPAGEKTNSGTGDVTSDVTGRTTRGGDSLSLAVAAAARSGPAPTPQGVSTEHNETNAIERIMLPTTTTTTTSDNTATSTATSTADSTATSTATSSAATMTPTTTADSSDPPTLKREKSMSDTLERRKKKVKFNPDEHTDELLVQTRVFQELDPLEALLQDSAIMSNTPLACKLKRLLKHRALAADGGGGQVPLTAEGDEGGSAADDADITDAVDTTDVVGNADSVDYVSTTKAASNVIDSDAVAIDDAADNVANGDAVINVVNGDAVTATDGADDVANGDPVNNVVIEDAVITTDAVDSAVSDGAVIVINEAAAGAVVWPSIGEDDTASSVADDNDSDELAFIDDGDEEEEEADKYQHDPGSAAVHGSAVNSAAVHGSAVNSAAVHGSAVSAKEHCSGGSLKREGTFSVEGSPPKKAMKPSPSLEDISRGGTCNENTDASNVVREKAAECSSVKGAGAAETGGGTQGRSVQQEVSTVAAVASKHEERCVINGNPGSVNEVSPKDELRKITCNVLDTQDTALPGGRHVTFAGIPSVDDRDTATSALSPPAALSQRKAWVGDAMELKADSLACKRRAKVNVEKPLRSCSPDTAEDRSEGGAGERVKPAPSSSSSSSSFRDSARKTLINAWKSAMKGTLGSEGAAKQHPPKGEPAGSEAMVERPGRASIVSKCCGEDSVADSSLEDSAGEGGAVILSSVRPRSVQQKQLGTTITNNSSSNNNSNSDSINKNNSSSSNSKNNSSSISNNSSSNSKNNSSSSSSKNNSGSPTAAAIASPSAVTGSIPKSSKIRPFKKLPSSSSDRSSHDSDDCQQGSSSSSRRTEKTPVVGTVAPFRRDGTFTKGPARWGSRQADGEKGRLEAEVRRLAAERDRLQGELLSAREWGEGEEAARKALRREQQQQLRLIRDEEAKKRDLLLAETRNRLEEEHREALLQQKAALSKVAEGQLLKAQREHADQLRRLRHEQQQQLERVRAEGRREGARLETSRCSPGATSREVERLTGEVAALREARRRLEDTVQVLQESERSHGNALRQLQAEHEGGMAALRREARHEQGGMMDQLKARDRTICQMQRQLAQAATKLQLVQEEAGRARSAEKAEETRRPLTRSNSSPGHQTSKTNSSKTSGHRNNSKTSNKQQQLQRDGSQASELPSDVGSSSSSSSMDGHYSSSGSAAEVARLREEVDQQKRTIRHLTLRIPQQQQRDDHQPLSLGHLPCISMDSVYDGLLRPLATRGRQDPWTPPGSDWLAVIGDLREENRNLRSDLQDARDTADLLEFRILELTEGADRFSESDEGSSVREVVGGSDDTQPPSPGSSSAPPPCGGQQHEDLSLPLSIDSGLDLTADCKKSRSSTSPKATVNNVITTTSQQQQQQQQKQQHKQPITSTPNNNTSTTMDTSSNIDDVTTIGEVTSTSDGGAGSSTVSSSSGSKTDVLSGELKSSDLTELAARLQEALANPRLQEEAMLEAIQKLRSLDASLLGLQSRVSCLTEENQYLQDAVSALSDAHETRTEASGTESEIVNNRKTPSLHSDLSDSESDSASSSSSRSSSSGEGGGGGKEGGSKSSSKRLDASSSFQESGIFEGPCDVVHSATQTELYSEACNKVVLQSTVAEQLLLQQREEDLPSAVARLTSIQSAVQGGGRHMRLQDLQDGEDLKGLLLGDPSSPSLLDGSSPTAQLLLQELGQLRTALDRMKAENCLLQENYDELSGRMAQDENSPSPRCRRCYETEEVEKGKSRVLQEQLRISESSRLTLYDEKCELEEAENDARLMVQRMDSQLVASREMECLLSASLSQEQEISEELHRKVKEMQALEKERSLRQGILERQSTSSVERVASLVMDRDAYASQLAFVRNGLLLLQVFNCLRSSNNRGPVVAYTPAAAVATDGRLAHSLDTSMQRKMFDDCDSQANSSLNSSLNSSSGMVDCAIDEALMEIGEEADESPAPQQQQHRGNSSATERFALQHMLVAADSKTNFTSVLSISGTSSPPAAYLASPAPRVTCDMCIQTEPVTFVEFPPLQPVSSSSEEGYACSSITVSCTSLPAGAADGSSISSPGSNVTVIDVQTSGPLVQDDSGKSPARVEMKSKSTMTIEEDLLSQRESYYLQQIHVLQEDKMLLRKEQEQERLESLQQHRDLDTGLQQAQCQLEDAQCQLADSERLRAALQCQLEEAREQREAACRDLHRRMDEMRADMARCSDLHELEKKALRRDFDARLAEISQEHLRYAARIAELEQQLQQLQQELEVVGVAIVADMTDYDGQPHQVLSKSTVSNTSTLSSSSADADAKHAAEVNSGSEAAQDVVHGSEDQTIVPVTAASYSSTCGSELLDKIRQLIKSESALRRTVTELEKKESAYRQTMQEADQIMAGHVTSFQQRIDELEAQDERRVAQIQLLQRNEDRLRSSMNSGARSEQDARVAELLQQLINTEKSELEFKAKLWNLEKNEKQLQIKLMEGEKVQQSLRAELRDQEELVQKMQTLHTENNALAHQLQKAHDGVRRVCEVQQSEQYLAGRVEELELAEHGLRDALQQATSAHATRERRLREQVSSLEEEVLSFRSQLEGAVLRDAEARDTEQLLRKQIDSLKTHLEDSKRDLLESSSESINYETQHRSEVSKMRSQLKLVNSQLSEMETIHCSLRERLAASEQLRETLERRLEESKRRHESDLLQLNLEASQRESRLEEAEGALSELTQLHSAHDLDVLASSPLAPVLRTMQASAAQLKLCPACSSAQGPTVLELNTQLTTLTDLLNGAPHSDGEDNAEEDSDEGEEVEERGTSLSSSACSADTSLVSDACDEQQPQLSQPMDTSETQAVAAAPCPRPGSPVPVPAPRRKRKQRREDTASLRGSFRARKKGATTILEELEEKVRELEESTARKEEELRLADGEAAELSSRLQATQEMVDSKNAEVDEFRRALSALQEQLVLSIEKNEVTKIKLECKYKMDEENMGARVQQLTDQLDRLAARGRLKDHIIATLIMQIRAILRTTNMGVVVTQIKQIGDRIDLCNRRKQQRAAQLQLAAAEGAAAASAAAADDDADDMEQQPDFDLEAVCDLLNRPREMSPLQ